MSSLLGATNEGDKETASEELALLSLQEPRSYALAVGEACIQITSASDWLHFKNNIL